MEETSVIRKRVIKNIENAFYNKFKFEIEIVLDDNFRIADIITKNKYLYDAIAHNLWIETYVDGMIAGVEIAVDGLKI